MATGELVNNVNSYFSSSLTNFKNTVYAMNISLYEYFAGLFFSGDQTRIVYSSTDYALRKRASTQAYNNLNFPFMNFKIAQSGILGRDVPRGWFNHPLFAQGIYSDDLQQYIKALPVLLTYDATLFVHQDIDAQYCMYLLGWQDGGETVVRLSADLNVGNTDHIIQLIGVVDFPNLDFNPQFNEQDWLVQNKIYTISLGFQIQTFYVDVNTDVSLVDTAILNFLGNNNIDLADSYDENYQMVVDHFTETITFE